MSYTQYVNGVLVQSNIPFNESPQSGSHYVMDLHFKVPLATLIASGINVLDFLTADAIVKEFIARGYKGKISNVKVYAKGNNDVMITFTADSPPVIIAIGVILGLLAVVLIFLNQVIINVSKNPLVGGLSLGVVAIVGVVLIFLMLGIGGRR